MVVATHGGPEAETIRAALDAGVGYVGLVASKVRGGAILNELGLTDAERRRVHTPVGLPIGAKTPAEIAVSILAEVVRAIRGRTTWYAAAAWPAALRARRGPHVCGMKQSFAARGCSCGTGDRCRAGRGRFDADDWSLSPVSEFADVDEVIGRFDATTISSTSAPLRRLPGGGALGRPLLLEGEPGVGKTTAAKTLAAVLMRRSSRLQCYEGLTASEALYDWNYQRQLLSIRLAEARGAGIEESDLYTETYLVDRPILQCVRYRGPARRYC